jgi:hypothetical protein
VGGILYFADERDVHTPATCSPNSFALARAQVQVTIATANLTYPRITIETHIKVPRSAPQASDLTLAEDEQSRRDAVGCLLDDRRSDLEIHDGELQITAKDGYVEIVERSHADINKPANVWAGLTGIGVRENSPWDLVVSTTRGLQQATWDVTISAPDGWLSTPEPWASADVQTSGMRWSGVIPDSGNNYVIRARLSPNSLTMVTTRAASVSWLPLVWGVSWISAYLFVFIAARATRNARMVRNLKVESRWQVNARHALRVFHVVVPVVALLSILESIRSAWAVEWDSIASWPWYIDIILAALTLVIAWTWWLPRVFVIMAGVMSMACLGFMRLWGDVAAFGKGSDIMPIVGVQALELGAIFIVTFTLIMAFGKALHVLIGGGIRRTAPCWLWVSGAVGATVLTVEKVVVLAINQSRREWLGYAMKVDPARAYRFHLWNLFDEFSWILLIVTAVALWHLYRNYWFEPCSPEAFYVAIILFAIGPMWWDIELRGVEIPVWIISLLFIFAYRWISERQRLPVLARMGGEIPTIGAMKRQVRQQSESDRRRRSDISPIDILIALGPGGSPRDNMIAAVRLSAVPAIVAGIGLCISSWLIYPILSINQENSVLLRLVDDAGWEAVKWLLAAAALGLSWQHLPGRRGVIKVLPMALAYAIGPMLLVGANWASGGTPDWLPLVNAGVFAVVFLLVGLRMDRAALEGIATETSNKFQTLLYAYGLEKFSTRLTALLTPVLLILAVISAVHGGDVSFPSVDSSQLTRK